MTIFQIIQKYKNNIDKLDAELLLAFVLKKTREFIVSNPKYKISLFQKIKFLHLVNKRKAGWSTAVLTKHKEFFGLNFKVDKNVLIPRPDTEIMVEKVLDIITPKSTLIDIGTGSGCIPISIIKKGLSSNTISIETSKFWLRLQEKIFPMLWQGKDFFFSSRSKFENFNNESVFNDNPTPKKVFAVDISKKALKIAKKNANTHNVKITFLKGNLLSNFTKLEDQTIITANLPYLTKKQFEEEKSIQKEPKLALIARENGLALYRKLLEQTKEKETQNSKIDLFMEINPEQKTELSKIIQNIFPNSKNYLYKDLSNQVRIVRVSLL